jgi:hypothetical protein
MTAPKVYALADPENGFWVYARSYGDYVLHVDGVAARPRETPGAQTDWWWTPGEPRDLKLIGPPTKETVSFTLPEGVTTPLGSPITVEQRRALFDDEGDPVQPWARLYEAVREDRDPQVTELPAPVMLLPGAPPPQGDGRRWVADLPWEVREHPEYLHLFPGHIPGFKQALYEHLGGRGFGGRSQVAGVDCYDDRETRALKIARTASYAPALTTTRKKRGGRGKETVPRTVTRTLLLLVPDSVKGANRADATARWDALWAKALELVEASNVQACGHCEGRGWLSDGPGENGERVVLWNEMGWSE